MKNLAMLAGAMLILVGCVASGVDPYPGDRLEAIKAGISSRNEVYAILGEPQTKRELGRHVFYARSRDNALTIDPRWPWAVWETFETVVVVFDQTDKVRSIDSIRGNAGCTEMGVCLEEIYNIDWFDRISYSLGDVGGEASLVLLGTLIFSDAEGDKQAKQYSTTSTGCPVYLHGEGSEALFAVDVSSTPVTRILIGMDRRGFLHWVAPPGEFTITGFAFSRAVAPSKASYRTTSREFICAESEMLFVHVILNSRGEPLMMELEEASQGKSHIGERRRLLN